jgi:hypothetical protein
LRNQPPYHRNLHPYQRPHLRGSRAAAEAL